MTLATSPSIFSRGHRDHRESMMNDPRAMAEMFAHMEEQIQQARQAVDINPKDFNALAKWGELLLELSMHKQGPGDNQEARMLLSQSQEKLEKSLALYPDNHNALVVLGSALNAKAFMQPDFQVANDLFEQAKVKFQRALELDPTNARYKELLEAMESAPHLYAQVMQQMQAQAGGGFGRGMGGGAPGAKESNEDWFYDWLGWGIFITGSFAILAMLNARAQPA